MSESAEAAPARRNLIVMSSVLLLIELSGATIKSINAPSVSIDIARPETLIHFLYASLFYLMFRFWQLSKNNHLSYAQISNKYINTSPYITHEAAEAVNASVNEDRGYYYSENNPAISRRLFKRYLSVSIYHKGHGETVGPIRISYFKIFIRELAADFRAIADHKDFIEYTFPLLYAFTVIGIKFVSMFMAMARETIT